MTFSFYRDKFQNQARIIQTLNGHEFEIKKNVWTFDINDSHLSRQSSVNGIDVSKM